MNIIGISGPARSGKDTLADLIIEILEANNVKCVKTSFAKQLKLECRDFLQSTIGIDSFTEKDEEKKIIRPFLVTWGTHVRRKLDPDVWVKSVASSVKDNYVTIVTDVRFKNEFDWIKENGGFSIFLDRALSSGDLVPNANADEEENNPFLKENCDYSLVWKTVNDNEKEWLSFVAYEVLEQAIPKETLTSWIQTCV